MEHDLKHIIIVDDHKLFSQSLKNLLQHRLKKVKIQEAASGSALFTLLENQIDNPDVILLDLEMPEMSGVEVARKLLSEKAYQDIKIIVLTMHDDRSFILNLIDEGVYGYVLKDADVSEILEAIQQVQNGQYYVSQNTFDAIRENVVNGTSFRGKLKGGTKLLSIREEEVLRLICEEYTNKEIAEMLQISTRTVDGHRNRLLKKTGMKNTAGLVKYALQNGLYELV